MSWLCLRAEIEAELSGLGRRGDDIADALDWLRRARRDRNRHACALYRFRHGLSERYRAARRAAGRRWKAKARRDSAFRARAAAAERERQRAIRADPERWARELERCRKRNKTDARRKYQREYMRRWRAHRRAAA